jgi:F-type H+-transporting ATPase subunit epsilon
MSEREHSHVLNVELVTPQGPAFVDEARMVIVPGSEGEIGALPRHQPLVAKLDPGETRIQRPGEDNWITFATGHGYFRVEKDIAWILVDTAENAGSIDVAAAEQARDDAKGRLDAAEQDEEIDAHRARLDLEDAENRLRVAGRT